MYWDYSDSVILFLTWVLLDKAPYRVMSIYLIYVTVVFRYNQILHLVSAAKGAEKYYTTAGHGTRKETLEEARERDDKASQAWVGHPYIEVRKNRFNL